MKTFFYLVISSILFIQCNTGKKGDSSDSDETADENATPAICMWNNLSVKDTPSDNGKYVTAANMGEKMIYLDSTVTDNNSSKKYQYSKIKLSDGTTGWIRTDLIAIDAEVAAVLKKAPICQRADLITKTNKSFEEMDIVAVLKSQNGWANVKGIIKGGTWYSEGWVQEDMLSFNTAGVTDAILVSKAMQIKDEKERLEELKRIYDIDHGEYSEFRPLINSLIGSLSKLDKRVYDAYKCWFNNQYNYDDGGESVMVLGKSFDIYDYTILGAVGSFEYCFVADIEEEIYPEDILEQISGISLYTNHFFDDDFTFRYVNTEFIPWAMENLVPKPEDDFLGTNLRRIYDVVIKDRVRVLADAYQIFMDDGSYTDRYREEVLDNGVDAFDFFMENLGQYDYDVRWMIGFWCRRDIDGSASELYDALITVMEIYDSEYFNGEPEDDYYN